MASPFKTITAAHARVTAGGTIWLLSGTNMQTATNSISKSGTASAHIRVQAVAGGTRPVLDFSGQAFGSSNRGIDVKGDYWEFRGFEIKNAGDNCIGISGSNNTFDQLVIHGCGDTGLQITASSSDATNDAQGRQQPGAQLRLVREPDQPTNGENADGFAAKLRIGPGNVFRGCRAWNNADDGWDFFASDDVVTIDNCWAFLNGKVAVGQQHRRRRQRLQAGRRAERRRRRRRRPHRQELVRVRQPRLRLRPQQQPGGPDAHQLRRQRQRHGVLQPDELAAGRRSR